MDTKLLNFANPQPTNMKAIHNQSVADGNKLASS